MYLVVNFGSVSLILAFTILSVLLISIILAIRFQCKQKKRYNECLKLIKEKEKNLFNVTDNFNIKQINDNIDINKLMMNLYDIYLEFVEKLNKNNKNFNGLLNGFIKEFYENKVDIYEKKRHFEITDNIELVNYSIIEYSKQKLKFRINITCFNYKTSKQKVISGSNLERVNQIFLVTYNKLKRKWLITNIEKVFEKKLSI